MFVNILRIDGAWLAPHKGMDSPGPQITAEWVGLPRDAAEYLAGGNTRLRLKLTTGELVGLSRQYLCRNTPEQVQAAWVALLLKLYKQDPELVAACVPDCIYRGWCFEPRSCGYHLTAGYAAAVDLYRQGVNGWDKEDTYTGVSQAVMICQVEVNAG